jgi:hypothetical protein
MAGLVEDTVVGQMVGQSQEASECAFDFKRLEKKMAETEGFEPSIGLYNPITV